MALRKICAQKNHTEVWYNIFVTNVNIDCYKEEPFCYAGRLFLWTKSWTKSWTIFD